MTFTKSTQNMQTTKRLKHKVYKTKHIEQESNIESKSTEDMTDRRETSTPGKKSKAMKTNNKRKKTYMNREQRKLDRQRRQRAFKIQKRFDDDRRGKQPQEVGENQFVIDHICYTTTSHACVKWHGYKQPTMEPLGKFFEDAPELMDEYTKKGVISEKEYLIYLKVRDQQKIEKRLRRKLSDGEENSSEVHTSEIEDDNEKEENENENDNYKKNNEQESTTEVEGSEEDLE